MRKHSSNRMALLSRERHWGVSGNKVAGSFVTNHSEHLLTFVPQSVVNELGGDMVVGLYGRSQRHKDAQDCEVVHVESIE